MIPLISPIDMVNTAFRAWLLSVTDPAMEIRLGQQNRVPPPTSANFIIFTQMGRQRLEGNIVNYFGDVNTRQVIQKTIYAYQVDVYGSGAGDIMNTVELFARDDSTQQFPAFIAMGGCITDMSDPIQMPWTDTEQQVEERWTATISVQVNASVTVPQDFANAVGDIILVNE